MTAPSQNAHDYDYKTDELVGSLFFKAIVTVSLTQSNVPSGLLKLDVYRFIQFYDYAAAEQHLQSLGVDRASRIDAEPRKAVFQLLGFICRSFPTSCSYQVMQELLKFGRQNPIPDTSNSTNRAPSGTFMRLRDDHQEPRYESQSDKRLPRYTSILYEEGARRNVTIGRTFSVLSLEPPRMKATVSFGALKATSIGRTKKLAGHMAAKEICDKLNLIVQLS
ncbi:hypothetical protein DPV78_001058 [Talaromyces pinophilus]|nr:hypothetical protein DPV78_001058 [Talaromyces pinophilus]